MRVFCLTNLYPPHMIGGYEVQCHHVMERLAERGHDVTVLTSTYPGNSSRTESRVLRWLPHDFDWSTGSHRPPWPVRIIQLYNRELKSSRLLERALAQSRPDVMAIWNMSNISLSTALLCQRRGIPWVYFLCDGWVTQYWLDPWYSLCSGRFAGNPSLSRRFVHKALSLMRPVLARRSIWPDTAPVLQHAVFNSRFLRDAVCGAGIEVQNAHVIHHAVDLGRFCYKERKRNAKRLLFVGQVTPHKGPHTGIRALGHLVHDYGHKDAEMTIVGPALWSDYRRELELAIDQLGLREQVKFAGTVGQDELPQVYGEHDVFVFPSVWDEPFGITPIEAMATGMPVVTTARGGSAEYTRDGENALVFPVDDAAACAEAINRLFVDRDLYRHLSKHGRETAERGHDIHAMVDAVERVLLSAVHSN